MINDTLTLQRGVRPRCKSWNKPSSGALQGLSGHTPLPYCPDRMLCFVRQDGLIGVAELINAWFNEVRPLLSGFPASDQPGVAGRRYDLICSGTGGVGSGLV